MSLSVGFLQSLFLFGFVFYSFVLAVLRFRPNSFSIPVFLQKKYLKRVLFGVALFVFTMTILIWVGGDVTNRDFASYAQVLWKLSIQTSPITTIFYRHFLANHWTPILWPLSWIYRVFPSPLLMLFIYQAAFWGGMYYLFKVVLKLTRHPLLTVAIWVSILLNPYLPTALLGRLNTDVWTFFALMGLLWAILSRNRVQLLLFSLIAVLCKEDAGLYLALFGIWACFRRHYDTGVFLMVLGLGVFWEVNTDWMLRFSNGSLENLFRYPGLGQTLPDILTTLLTHPLKVFKLVLVAFVENNGWYPLMAWLPFAVMGGINVLLTLPVLGIRFLSDNPEMHALFNHYLWHVLPFICLVVASGALWWVNWFRSKGLSKQSAFNSVSLLLIISSLLFWTPTHYFAFNIGRTAKVKALLAQIPPHAGLLGDSYVLALSPNRSQLIEVNRYLHQGKSFQYPMAYDFLRNVDYALFDAQFEEGSTGPKFTTMDVLMAHPDWVLISKEDDLYLFKRKR